MYRLILLSALLITTYNSFSQTAQSYSSQAIELYKSNDYLGAQKAILKAIEMGSTNHWDYYNAACFSALVNDEKNAFKYIDSALIHGKEWYSKIDFLTEKNLTNLKDSKKWKEVFGKTEAQFDFKLREELLEISEKDQNIRNEFGNIYNLHGPRSTQMDSFKVEMEKVDLLNIQKISTLLDSVGWVSSEKVGKKACETQFLIIQHSPIEYQKKYYPYLKKAAKNGDLRMSILALLVDRLRLGSEKKQIYGSQMGYDKEKNERYVLPLKSPKQVDKRRTKAGMSQSISEYLGNYGLDWDYKVYKKNLPRFTKLMKEQNNNSKN